MSNLFAVPVDQIAVQTSNIVTIGSHDTVPQALKVLSVHKIYCAPVIENTSVIGLIDLVDIVAFISGIFDDNKLVQHDFVSRMASEKIWNSEHAGEISNMSKKNHLMSVPRTTPLRDAVKLLNEQGCRRMLIQEDGGKVIGILTQSTIIAYLHKNLKALGGSINSTVKDLNLGSDVVVSVKEDDSVIEAFRLMSKHRITSVAILEENGKLLSNISAKDLKVVVSDKDMFSNLYKTSREFVSLARQLEYELEFAASITCRPTDTLETVIKKLAVTKIHRIYVVDEAHRPLRVVSLTDILKVLNL